MLYGRPATPLILVFGCAHVEPRQDLWRFEALGNLIVKQRPEQIVQLGDFLTLNSLSHWGRDKSGLMEGRRYNEDIQAGQQAIRKMVAPLISLQKQQVRNHKKVYKPNLIWCLGNHEDWERQYVDEHPVMQGKLDLVKSLGLRRELTRYFKRIHIVPYRSGHIIGGVNFTHAVMNASNKPTTGKYAVQRVLEYTHGSTVFAHTHQLGYSAMQPHGGPYKQALMVGTFSEHTGLFAQGGLNHWWRGLILLHPVKHGVFDFQTISLAQLERI